MNNSTSDLHGQGVYLPSGARPPRFTNQPQYAPMPEATPLRSSPWLEKEQSRSRRSKFIVIGALALIVVVIVGVAVGVTVAKKNKPAVRTASGGSPSSSSSTSGGSSGNSTGSGAVTSDPNDPSNFVKDPNLHNAFFGLAYTPVGAILPQCGATQEDVITDIQLMSQLTNRIRLYGADCNVTELVLNAIAVTKVDMTVYLGNFIVIGDDTAYTRQKAAIETALMKYGAEHVFGVTVGNEVMLNFCTDHNLPDATSSAVQPAVDYISAKIADTRAGLAALNLGKTLQVGNSDAGSYFATGVLSVIDYGLANVHPWFAQQDVSVAANWTVGFFQDTNVQPASLLPNKPVMYIAETGWPTASDDAQHATDGAPGSGGLANEANLQTFLDTFVCSSNTGGINYFFFEFFDEAWKAPLYGGVEAHWGLFTTDKKLKNIKIPTCSHP